VSVPTLDELAKDATRAAGLSAEVLAALASVCTAALMNITAQLAVIAKQPSAITVAADELLTAKQVAERWSVPETWVREKYRAGMLPFVQLGRYVRFRPLDLERYLQTAGKDAQAPARLPLHRNGIHDV